MTAEWQYQIRFDIADEATADTLRRQERSPALTPLLDVLAAHGAEAKCQYDAFADYVAAAERGQSADYPLYRWTKATIEDPAKKAKYQRSFAIYVGGREVYAKEIADAIAADLLPLAESGLIQRLTKRDSNPANNPQPPKRFR